MGYRTVVMLSNDRSSEWKNDPELGKKIARAIACLPREYGDIGYGTVVQCVHADVQTIAIVDGYEHFQVLANTSWYSGQTDDDKALTLLKQAADKLGYVLRKKPSKS